MRISVVRGKATKGQPEQWLHRVENFNNKYNNVEKGIRKRGEKKKCCTWNNLRRDNDTASKDTGAHHMQQLFFFFINFFLFSNFFFFFFIFWLNTPISCHSRFSHSRAWSSPLGLTRRWDTRATYSFKKMVVKNPMILPIGVASIQSCKCKQFHTKKEGKEKTTINPTNSILCCIVSSTHKQ